MKFYHGNPREVLARYHATKHGAVIQLDSEPFNGLEFSPDSLRALGAALIQAADCSGKKSAVFRVGGER
jgi:hypothetical protein